jgi:hypothetical protein
LAEGYPVRIVDERSYKNGKELSSLMDNVYGEIKAILMGVDSLRHDEKPNEVQKAFEIRGWESEKRFRKNRMDCFKNGVAIDIECSHTVHLDTDLRDFSLFHRLGKLKVGVLIIDLDRIKTKFDTICKSKIEQYDEDILVPLVVFGCKR